MRAQRIPAVYSPLSCSTDWVTGPMVHTIFVRSQSLGGAFSNMLDMFRQRGGSPDRWRGLRKPERPLLRFLSFPAKYTLHKV